MQVHRLHVALLTALALLCSCQADSAAPTPDNFIHAFVSHACAAQERCGLSATFSLAKCREVSAARYEEGKLGFLLASVKAGDLGYDREQASQCLSAVDSSACDGTEDLSGLCAAVFTGDGTQGAGCDAGCVLGDCQQSVNRYTAKVAEACVGLVSDGERCGSNLACVTSIDNTTSQCTPRVAAGQRCREGYPNSCTPDSYCSVDGNGNGICRPLPKAGEPCTDSIFALCAYGLECSTGKLCHEQGRIGDACANEAECISGHCVKKLCAEAPLCP